YMGDVLFYNQDRIAAESFLETATERRSVLNLLRLIGYELRPPTAASADLTLLFDPKATGTVTLNPGMRFMTTKQTTGEVINFQYLRQPLTLDLTSLPLFTLDATGALAKLPAGQTPDGSTFRLFRTLPVVHADPSPTASEIIGSSDGSPNQVFR